MGWRVGWNWGRLFEPHREYAPVVATGLLVMDDELMGKVGFCNVGVDTKVITSLTLAQHVASWYVWQNLSQWW